MAAVQTQALWNRVEFVEIRYKSRQSAPKPMKQSKKTEKLHECAALLQQGLSLHQAGRLEEAYQFYKKILRIDSKYFDALQFSAVLQGQRGNQTAALELFDQALELNRTNVAVEVAPVI